MVWQAFRLWLPQQEVWAGGAWSSDLAVSCTLAKLSDIQSETQDSKRYVSHHWPVSPLTQQLGLCFLRSLRSPTVNIRSCLQEWSCHELDCMECHPHTGFITPNFLHICVWHDYSRISNTSGIISMGVSIGKCLTYIQIRHLVRLFEFHCECTAIRRNFKFCFVWLLYFFACTVYFASNPLTEFCYVHLNFTAVGRHHEVCRKLL